MEKEKNKIEKYAEKYLLKKGYNVRLIKQYISKSIYNIEKNDIKYNIEIPSNVINVKKYMDLIDFSFHQKEKIEELKKKLNKRN